MKFQIEFLEITKNFEEFDQEKALELTHRVCADEMTRQEAIEELGK